MFIFWKLHEGTVKAKQMKLRPHGTDTIDSRVCQQSLTEGRTSQHGEKSPKLLQTENKMEQEVQEELDSRTAAEQEARHSTQEPPRSRCWDGTWLRWDGRIGWRCAHLHSQCSGSGDRKSSVNGGRAWLHHSRPASATDTALKRRGREGKKEKGRWDQCTQIFETLQIANHRLFF